MPTLRSAFFSVFVPLTAGLLATLVVSSANAEAPELKCTPPRPVNLSLALAVVPDGANAGPGSEGRLVFTFRHLDSQGRASPVFVGHYPAHGLMTGPMQTLHLSEAKSESCVVTQQFEMIGGELRLFYTAFLPDPLAPGDSGRCQVDFRIDAGSLYRESIEFTARPYDCAIDPDLSDNRAVFNFGGADLRPQPKGVPVFANDARSIVLFFACVILVVVTARRFGPA